MTKFGELPPHQLLVLIALDEHYCSYLGAGEFFLPFKAISSVTGLDRAQVKRAVRRLARCGFAEYSRGLMSEDGEVAGSGYACTKAGHEHLKSGPPLPEPPQ